MQNAPPLVRQHQTQREQILDTLGQAAVPKLADLLVSTMLMPSLRSSPIYGAERGLEPARDCSRQHLKLIAGVPGWFCAA
jgi:hypothetical protein